MGDDEACGVGSALFSDVTRFAFSDRSTSRLRLFPRAEGPAGSLHEDDGLSVVRFACPRSPDLRLGTPRLMLASPADLKPDRTGTRNLGQDRDGPPASRPARLLLSRSAPPPDAEARSIPV